MVRLVWCRLHHPLAGAGAGASTVTATRMKRLEKKHAARRTTPTHTPRGALVDPVAAWCEEIIAGIFIGARQ